MKKPIESFGLVDHGIEHEQYFQGCGISHTVYTDLATGFGNNPKEAIDDALESLALADWDVEGMEARICEDMGIGEIPESPTAIEYSEDNHYYFSILVK